MKLNRRTTGVITRPYSQLEPFRIDPAVMGMILITAT
jgi:hypothetical protein